MNNTTNSPQSNQRPKAKRSGLGCTITFVILLVGLGAAVAIGGPRLLNRLAAPTAAVPLPIEDNTSPQQLAERQQQQITQLNGYGWVDQEAGIARIPITRAIALLAESGLPVGAAASAATDVAADSADAPAVDLTNVNYQDNVLPIFQQHCSECHGDEDQEEGLKLTTYRSAINGSQNGQVIEPGDPDGSYLVDLVVSGEMPKRGDRLSDGEIETIITWIEAGAPEVGTATAEASPAISESATSTVTAQTPITSTVDLTNVSFQHDVLPIFEQYCTKCHGDEDPEEGLKLTSYENVMAGSFYGAVVKPGDPDTSYLVEMIVTGQMPKRGADLTQTEIDTIIAWIEAGAQNDEGSTPVAAPVEASSTLSATDEVTATTPISTATETAIDASDTPTTTDSATIDLTNVNYEKHVLPIFEQHCAECHGDEEPEEGLKLTSYRSAINGSQNGPVIEPGDPDNSYLVELVVSGEMPKRGERLSDSEIETIVAWIEAGAPEE